MSYKSDRLDTSKLRGRAAELGLTQAQLAKQTGISPRTIASIFLSGEVKTAAHIGLLAKALQIDISGLYPSDTYSNNTQTGHGNAIGSSKVHTSINSNEEEKQALLTQIEVLKEDKKKLELEKERLLNIIEILSKK